MLRTSFLQREAALFFRHARRIVQNPAFDVLIAYAAYDTPKLLIVTSARIGNAPERNRVRRRIKAIFHEFEPVNSAYDVAFIIKKPGLRLSFHELLHYITTELKPYASAAQIP